MMLLGKTIQTYRGETFGLSMEILNKDGVPYTPLIRWKNPYLLFQVRSSQFDEKNHGHIYNFWLDLSTYPKFKSNTPEFIDGYELPEEGELQTLYYMLNEDGVREYYYYDGTQWKEYSFVVTHYFLNVFTKDWIQSTWWYTISIVTGELMKPYLKRFVKGLKQVPDSELYDDTKWLYDKLKFIDKSYVTGINPEYPLVNYTTVDTLQKQNKLVVK